MKKIISIILAAFLIMALIPLQAFAAQELEPQAEYKNNAVVIQMNLVSNGSETAAKMEIVRVIKDQLPQTGVSFAYPGEGFTADFEQGKITFTDATAEKGKTYVYTIKAYHSNEDLMASDAVSIDVPAAQDLTQKIWVGGVELSHNQYLASGNDVDAPSPSELYNNYAHWDAQTKTLTLYNYSFKGKGYDWTALSGSSTYKSYASIFSDKDFTLRIRGTNTIENICDSIADKEISDGIVCYSANMSIEGTGTLNIKANTGISLKAAADKKLKIAATVNIEGNEADDDYSMGIYAEYGDIEISGMAELSINHKEHKTRSYGIYVSGRNSENSVVEISSSAKVNIKTGKILNTSGNSSYGIYANRADITVDGNVRLKVESGGHVMRDSIAIFADNGSITVADNAAIQAKAGEAEGGSANAISADKIYISGNAEVKAEAAAGIGSAGILAQDIVEISGNADVEAIANAGGENGYSIGIFAADDGATVSLSGNSSVYAKGSDEGEDAMSVGIYAEEKILIEGNAEVEAINAGSSTYAAVYAYESINIGESAGRIVLVGETSAEKAVEGSPLTSAEDIKSKLFNNETGKNYHYFKSYPGSTNPDLSQTPEPTQTPSATQQPEASPDTADKADIWLLAAALVIAAAAFVVINRTKAQINK